MKEIKVFEKGDYARIKEKRTHCFKVGTMVKVMEEEKPQQYLRVENNGVKQYVCLDEIEFCSKFKVGDKVVAKKNAPYSITTDGWEGVVTEVCNNGRILVNGEGFIGSLGAGVEERYFDLCKPKCCDEIKEIKKEIRKLQKKLKKLCKNT